MYIVFVACVLRSRSPSVYLYVLTKPFSFTPPPSLAQHACTGNMCASGKGDYDTFYRETNTQERLLFTNKNTNRREKKIKEGNQGEESKRIIFQVPF